MAPPVPADPRFLDLQTDDPAQADWIVAGVPFDGSVIGRKGARHGPAAIREAMRFLASLDPDTGTDLAALRWHDAGDVEGLDPDDTLATHATVRAATARLFSHGKPLVLLGGDHGLTFPHLQGFADARRDAGHEGGRIGIIVIDAHYDLRAWEGQPTSGTPFRRLLEELEGLDLEPGNLVEIGIRPWANTASLARYAKEQGVHVVTPAMLRRDGLDATIQDAIARATDGVDHLWLSIDIDGLDQSIAAGCSSPGAGGLTFDEAAAITAAAARHPLFRGLDILEVAPELDPTGNTPRTAAQLLATAMGARVG
ncbi:MAG: agmatinase family protein [Thermoplasmatota archaeon]